MDDLIDEMLDISNTYFQKMDEEFDKKSITMLIESSIDEYKMRRAYPESYTDEMIERDVTRYFGLRKSYIAAQVIPELYGRMGGEGLAMLTDAGTTRMWKNSTLFNDVLPICEVV